MATTEAPAEVAAAALKALGRGHQHLRLMREGSAHLYVDDRSATVVRVSDSVTAARRALGVALALRAAGVPVLEPLASEPFESGPLCATVWPLVDGGPRVTPEWLGAAAAGLHRATNAVNAELAMRGLELDSFVDTEREKALRRLSAAAASDRFDALLLSALSEAVEHLGRGPRERADVVLHGDLYLGNVVSSVDGRYLIDLDMVSSGPRCGDAAPLAVSERRFGATGAYAAFVHGYGGEPWTADELGEMMRLREATMVAWICELACRRPELLDEAGRRVKSLVERDDEAAWQAA